MIGGNYYVLIDCVDVEKDVVCIVEDIYKEIIDKYIECFKFCWYLIELNIRFLIMVKFNFK